MRILITGGAGFIGSNFIFYEREHHPEYELICLDKLTYAGNAATLVPLMNDPRFAFIQADILDRESIYGIFETEKPDIVVNFAAESHAWLETDGRIGGIDTELLRVNQNIDAVNSELLRINQTTDAINSELLRMNQSADVVNGELLRINQTTDGINSELLRMNQSADAVNGELLRMNQSADAVNGELLRINQTTDGINTELLRMNQNADAVNGELLRINQTTDDINTELLRMNRNADILNIRLQEIADAAAGREAQLQELTQTLAETSERLARIERSFWYRLGRAITWLPRKLRTMVSK